LRRLRGHLPRWQLRPRPIPPPSSTGPALPPRHFASRLPAILDEYLNLRQILLRVSPKDHPRPLHVDLTGGQDDLVVLLLDERQNLGVGPAQFLIRPLVQ